MVFGDQYNLPNWHDSSVVPSTDVPANALGFKIATGLAAKAVIFLDVPGVSSTAPSMYRMCIPPSIETGSD
jgi:hypothetical protein